MCQKVMGQEKRWRNQRGSLIAQLYNLYAQSSIYMNIYVPPYVKYSFIYIYIYITSVEIMSKYLSYHRIASFHLSAVAGSLFMYVNKLYKASVIGVINEHK